MRRFRRSLWMAAVLATPVAVAQPPAAADSRDLCAGHRSPHVMCAPGNGRRTPGGGDKTSHAGWQRDALDGGPGNDWIYSSHGHNDISGGAGNDHIWGHYGHGTIDCGPG